MIIKNSLKMKKKKKRIFLLFTILGLILLIGVGLFIQSRLVFQGTIIEVSDNTILVEVTDNSIANGLYFVAMSDHTKLMGTHLNHLSSQDLIVGEQVRIMFNGSVFESYPAMISTCYYIWILDD